MAKLGNNIVDSGDAAPTVVLPPWVQNPFALISWLDMHEFAAHELGRVFSALTRLMEVGRRSGFGTVRIGEAMDIADARGTADDLAVIGCPLSAASFRRLADDGDATPPGIQFEARISEISLNLDEEVRRNLFFAVPPERAAWYSKKAEEILGEECLLRFSKADVGKEAQRAARCYAFGEWTACGFHMVRVGDAGVRAFGKAICYAGTFSWGSVYQYLVQERDNKKTRGTHWTGNEQFLEEAALHLRDIKPYRDEVAHFRTTYEDKDAEFMMGAIPSFMKRLASRLDEDGNWLSPSSPTP